MSPGADPILEVIEHPGGIRRILLGGRTPDAPFVLSRASLAALEETLRRLEAESGLEAITFETAHRDVFCAGADVDEIAALPDAAAAEPLLRRGQELMDRIASARIPTAALIHGTCVGGGFELALACRFRVASDGPATRLGLPEVRLGIIPAWGGCTRLVRLAGFAEALELIPAGRTLAAGPALRRGLVDAVVPREHLLAEGLRLFVEARRGAPPRAPQGPLLLRLASALSPGRRMLARAVRRRVERETRGHYPAPLAAISVLERTAAGDPAAGLRAEREEVLRLLATPAHRELIRLFRIGRESARPPIYRTGRQAPPIHEIAVVGAGVMGAGIAALALARGLGVRVIDRDPGALARSAALADQALARLRDRREITQAQALARRARLSVSTQISGLRGVDLVLEAVPEKRDLKERVLAGISSSVRPGTLIATNTSSFEIVELARSAGDPAGFLGLHFFNPPERMPLLEIVRGSATSDAAVARALRLASDLGKTPVVVGDGPGFLVNRILAPCFQEALAWAADGADPLVLDHAMEAYGLPMGPFRLMDAIGLDIVLDASRNLHARLGPEFPVDPRLEALVQAGRLGDKSGGGFYERRGQGGLAAAFRHALPSKLARPAAPDVVARLVGRMVREARSLLEQGLVLSAEEVDLATVYGLGFPPFRGGLLRAAAMEGLG